MFFKLLLSCWLRLGCYSTKMKTQIPNTFYILELYLNDRALLSLHALQPHAMFEYQCLFSPEQWSKVFAFFGSKERIANPGEALVSLQCIYAHIFLFDFHSTLEREQSWFYRWGHRGFKVFMSSLRSHCS